MVDDVTRIDNQRVERPSASENVLIALRGSEGTASIGLTRQEACPRAEHCCPASCFVTRRHPLRSRRHQYKRYPELPKKFTWLPRTAGSVSAPPLQPALCRQYPDYPRAVGLDSGTADRQTDKGLACGGHGMQPMEYAPRKPTKRSSAPPTHREIVRVLSIGLTTGHPPTNPSSLSDATEATRRGPPVSGRTYMQPAWSGTTDTTSW